MSDFVMDLNQHDKALLLIGCLPIPFNSVSACIFTTPFVASAVGKIRKLQMEKLHKLEAQWLTK